MTASDIKPLLAVEDKVIADEIKRILEEAGIYSLLESDNPASSFHQVYMGSAARENITLSVTLDSFEAAQKVIQEHGYQDLLV